MNSEQKPTTGRRGHLVGGLWCSDVLDGLQGFVDGEMEPGQVDQVNTHLGGCDWCQRFGGEYGALVGRLRAELERSTPLPEAISRRLSLHLTKECRPGDGPQKG